MIQKPDENNFLNTNWNTYYVIKFKGDYTQYLQFYVRLYLCVYY